MTDLSIVSGDLVYVISDCGQAHNTATDTQSKTVMACSSDCESNVNSSISEMETEIIGEHCTKAVVKDGDDGDKRTECDRTEPNVSDTELSASGLDPENRDSFPCNNHKTVAEVGSTGVSYAMSAEELHLVNRYLNEPMVVREANDHALPQTLVLAYSVIQPQTADAALLTVVDILMSELGYQRTTVGSVRLHMISTDVNESRLRRVSKFFSLARELNFSKSSIEK